MALPYYRVTDKLSCVKSKSFVQKNWNRAEIMNKSFKNNKILEWERQVYFPDYVKPSLWLIVWSNLSMLLFLWLCLHWAESSLTTGAGEDQNTLNTQILFCFICDKTITDYTKLQGKVPKLVKDHSAVWC